MADRFQDQGGVATSDPSPLLRFLTSKLMTRLVSPAVTARRRQRAEKARRRTSAPHRIEYFHQVEDGYSHLAAQLLQPLVDAFDVELVCHLVTVENDRNLPEPDLLLPLSRYDAAQVAPHYGLRFPAGASAPAAESIAQARRILADVDAERFPEAAVAVGDALWAGDAAQLATLAERFGEASEGEAAEAIRRGTARRSELGHYSGAMFHYGREWYWGADRFYLLEQRLAELGAGRIVQPTPICPRPSIETGPLQDDGSLTLEFYPSVRSPYTGVIFDTTLRVARETGVRLMLRPVLPMVMRGVPATRQKGMYIFSDAAREAAALGIEWGHFCDPIGEPARNCYSLYPWACKQGKGAALLSSFLRAAFVEGVNTNRTTGMRHVVEDADLSWDDARTIIGNRDWEDEIEANRLAMYDFGSWGVPSYRLIDSQGRQVLGLWGQDRLWLVAREIQRLLREAG